MTHAEYYYNQLVIKLTYLYNLLMFDFSYLKFIIIGIIVLILFECIIGWYMPEQTKQYRLKQTQSKQSNNSQNKSNSINNERDHE